MLDAHEHLHSVQAARVSNSSKKSASRSMTLITRVLRLKDDAASSMSRKPSSQRCILLLVLSGNNAARGAASSGGCSWTGGASKPQRSTPSGSPAPLTARVRCRCRPSVSDAVWLRPMMPRPSQFGRVAKFRSVPSWMHSTVSSPRIRCIVRVRWGARMFAGVTADCAGCSMSR